MILIAIESTRTFSSENTSGWLRPFVERALGRMSESGWAELHHLLRKSAHFCGYGGVCVSFARAWLWRDLLSAIRDVWRWRWTATLKAIASTAAVAAADEFHQTFLSNRTGKVSDVLLDTLGGTAACGILWAVFWRRDRDRYQNDARAEVRASQ